MQTIELSAPSLDSFRIVERPDPPPPGPGRVLLAMKAASLNYADLAVATGNYPGAPFPNVVLADGAAEVVAVGADVWQVAPGDRVAVHMKPYWIGGPPDAARANPMRGATAPGVAAGLLDADANAVVPAPAHLDWDAIATLPIAATTAHRALEMGAVGPASTVVLRGTGGVSIFALQLARARGARVIVTSSSDEKCTRARTLGAAATVNYRTRGDWDAFVLEQTGGIGADLVLDPVGGDGVAQSINAVRHGGAVSLIGFLGGGAARLDLLPAIFKEVRVQGANGGSVADLRQAVAIVAAHRIVPVVDRVFGVAELADAYRLMARGGHFGKLVVRFDWE